MTSALGISRRNMGINWRMPVGIVSVGKRQEKQARETMRLREKDSKKQDKERENYRNFQEDEFVFL